MVTKKTLSKEWDNSYGENFRTEYPGVYKALPKTFSVDRLKSEWKKAYGENFASNYSGVHKKLKLTKKCPVGSLRKAGKCVRKK